MPLSVDGTFPDVIEWSLSSLEQRVSSFSKKEFNILFRLTTEQFSTLHWSSHDRALTYICEWYDEVCLQTANRGSVLTP